MGSISPYEEKEDLSFHDLPPFPSDVPIVPLHRISLKKLVDGNKAEDEKLWRACCDLGFFYLDLRSGNGTSAEGQTIHGDDLLQATDLMFPIANELFDLPKEEKQKHSYFNPNKPMTNFGYKDFGGPKDGRTPDNNEFWNVGKDDVLGHTAPEPNPELLTRSENRKTFQRFVLGSNAIVQLIIARLNSRLALPEGTLQDLHRLERPSGDIIRWIRSPPQPANEQKTALGEHTDFGSVTILFNRLGGLQVLPPDQDEWAYVKPLNGHCIVNLGDAMVKFSAGILRSNIHRVAPTPGEQQNETRYSLVYFNRPADDVIMKKLKGSSLIDKKAREAGIEDEEEDITARKWILNRAVKGKSGTDKERLEKRNRVEA